ncbi:MAG: hypothetical protein BWY44_00938 [Candidatus Omnitrophica bacterium ADurb.Bin292]|nr:MAG: hypothetical protein BWY44_00938 [Candidatus Omnitrophica bacterium ADurb.Bin292]
MGEFITDSPRKTEKLSITVDVAPPGRFIDDELCPEKFNIRAQIFSLEQAGSNLFINTFWRHVAVPAQPAVNVRERIRHFTNANLNIADGTHSRPFGIVNRVSLINRYGFIGKSAVKTLVRGRGICRTT